MSGATKTSVRSFVTQLRPYIDFRDAARNRDFALPSESRFANQAGGIETYVAIGPYVAAEAQVAGRYELIRRRLLARNRRGRLKYPAMYRYDVIDKTLVNERVAQFRDQTRRFLAGELSEDEFRHLRLRNGLYIQRHAPMLRVAIPYGLLSSTQLRTLAADCATLRPRLRPFHDAAEHPVQLAEARGRCRIFWPSSPPWRCTRYRPAATAFAT